MMLTITPLFIDASYVSTGRDTQENPDTISDIPAANYDVAGYAKLTENDNFIFYWQEDRDVLVIHDKRNGYTWKTGLDIDPTYTKAEQSSLCKDLKRQYNNDQITYEEFESGCAVPVDTITGTTSGPLMANSLLYFEYFSKGASDSVYQNNTVYSSYLKSTLYKVTSTLQMLNGDENTYRFTVYAQNLGVDKDLDLNIIVDMTLSEDGFVLNLRNEDLSGTALPYLSSIGLATFLGAVGGIDAVFYTTPKVDTVLGDYDYTEVQRDMVDGYSFVPDGSGALIRFLDNSVSLSKYNAYV